MNDRAYYALLLVIVLLIGLILGLGVGVMWKESRVKYAECVCTIDWLFQNRTIPEGYDTLWWYYGAGISIPQR